MVWSLTWRHALTDGTAQADTHVTALLKESEFFVSGATLKDALVETNTTSNYLETANPQHIWRMIEKITEAGDGVGGAWMAGAYPNWQFRFEARPTGTQYRIVNGQLQHYGGGEVLPLEFRPDWCWMSDMPTEPQPAGGGVDDDPKRVWLDETWFVWDGENISLEWSRDSR
jgi:hypothetical protein